MNNASTNKNTQTILFILSNKIDIYSIKQKITIIIIFCFHIKMSLMKAENDKIILTGSKRKKRRNRCWRGYRPVRGKKAYSKGSCRKVGKKKLKF